MRAFLAACRAFATLVGVWLFIQVLPRLLPEDPARIAAGEWAGEAEVAAFRKLMGLDLPVLQALGASARELLHGRLGTSLRFNRPVADILLGGLPVSLRLACFALLLSMLLAWLLAAGRRGRGRTLQAAAIASPVYVLGPLLLWAVAQHVPGLPVAGVQGWASWILPSFTLAVPLAGHQARVLSAQLEEVRESPGLRWWRASGVPPGLRWRAWLLPAVSGPWLTVLGLQLGGLLGGAVLAEAIFALPGLGQILLGGLASRDLPLVQGAVLWGAGAYVATQLGVEWLQGLLDPRVR
ncbi:MAG: ABC transporter permease [Holophagaceae bacterium]|nr:ABC transporter permease [Holophagaceae bacterium]